jgi:tRNA modification GTPase
VREARDALLGVLSHIEAAIDFPDDRLDPMADAEAAERLRAIRARIGEILARSREGLLVREGFKTALVGRPNVGKSSLMNALLGKDRMIVSDVPGTTRDTVEEELQVRGLAVRLVDTAGLGRAVSPLESAARARSEEAIASSDLVLFVVDGSEPPSEGDFAAWEGIRGKPRFLVVNKCDRLAAPALDGYLRLGPRGAVVRTSCRDGSGLAELEGRIASYVLEQAPERPAEAWLTSVRHAELFRKAHGHLADAAAAFERGLSGECAAVDVRLALDALGEVVGEAVTDDLLDRIFSRFCIGK